VTWPAAAADDEGGAACALTDASDATKTIAAAIRDRTDDHW